MCQNVALSDRELNLSLVSIQSQFLTILKTKGFENMVTMKKLLVTCFFFYSTIIEKTLYWQIRKC